MKGFFLLRPKTTIVCDSLTIYPTRSGHVYIHCWTSKREKEPIKAGRVGDVVQRGLRHRMCVSKQSAFQAGIPIRFRWWKADGKKERRRPGRSTANLSLIFLQRGVKLGTHNFRTSCRRRSIVVEIASSVVSLRWGRGTGWYRADVEKKGTKLSFKI